MFLGVSFVSFAALGSSTKVFKTNYTLNGIGQLTGAQVRDGLPKDVAYTLDGLGQIVRRKEVRTTGTNTGLGPNELFYRFAGKQMGMVGNNGTVDTGYVQSVADRSRGTPDPTASTAGIFRDGAVFALPQSRGHAIAFPRFATTPAKPGTRNPSTGSGRTESCPRFAAILPRSSHHS